MKLKSLALRLRFVPPARQPGLVAGVPSRRRRSSSSRSLVYRHRRLCTQRHALRQRLRGLHEAGQCQGRHQRREGDLGRVRTQYATDRGVECYERLKGKHGGAYGVHPLSTGITYARDREGAADKIPLITSGYGRSESTDGMVFKWNFPLVGTYWVAADILLQHISKKEGGWDKLKGKKIALVYHDSPYGKEPIAMLQERAQDARLRADDDSGHASGRRAEGDVAADPSEPARLRVPVGLGRDELHRPEGSGGHRLPAREDVRRVVGRCRAGCQGRGRCAPRATTA